MVGVEIKLTGGNVINFLICLQCFQMVRIDETNEADGDHKNNEKEQTTAPMAP